eukprot:gene10442-1089_t
MTRESTRVDARYTAPAREDAVKLSAAMRGGVSPRRQSLLDRLQEAEGGHVNGLVNRLDKDYDKINSLVSLLHEIGRAHGQTLAT